MSYRSRRADLDNEDDVDHLRELHKLTFTDGSFIPDFDYGAWWLLAPALDFLTPVAFCGVVPSTLGFGYAYLKRAGVLAEHQGHGLQRRMIRLREQWARREGFHTIVTETVSHNTHSANNLAACGFKMFEPAVPWGHKIGVGLYYKKALTPRSK